MTDATPQRFQYLFYCDIILSFQNDSSVFELATPSTLNTKTGEMKMNLPPRPDDAFLLVREDHVVIGLHGRLDVVKHCHRHSLTVNKTYIHKLLMRQLGNFKVGLILAFLNPKRWFHFVLFLRKRNLSLDLFKSSAKLFKLSASFASNCKPQENTN